MADVQQLSELHEVVRERYVEYLLDRLDETNYPSKELMDRIEPLIYTPEQLERYLEFLVQRIEETTYPSKDLMNRLERVMYALPRNADNGSEG